MESTTFYTQKAAHCRRLAKAVNDAHATAALSALAEELETLAAEANPYSMHDPRTFEIIAQLEAMPLEDRLAMMLAMAFTFPLLKDDHDWKARIEAALGEIKPSAEEHGDIMVRAGRISRRVKAELASAQPQR